MSHALFQPFQLKSLHLANRVVMAPMTRSRSPNGIPGADVAAYYARRAGAGVGLIITEGTSIDRPGASFDANVPNFHAAESLAGWAKVVDAVHRAGGKIAPQLWHVGMMRKPGTGPNPDAESDGPSGLSASGKSVGKPMDDADIAGTIEAFAAAALAAQNIGFDCVEFHGAHGYLLDQFFWERSNQRQDRFGGALPQRATFVAEIVKAARARVRPDFPLILRYSQWKQQDYSARLAQTPQELEAFLAPLCDAGIDSFHCSQRRYWEPEFADSPLNLAGWTKKITGLPSITVGSVGLKGADFIHAFRGESAEVGDLSDLETRLEAGEFDLVAVGRALISDPEWAAKVRDGRTAELVPFTATALGEYV